MPSDLIPLVVIVAGTGVGVVIDLRTRRVPNALTMSLAGAGVVLAASGFGRVGVVAALTGCLLGLSLMLPGHILGATGAGDVKLLAAAGTLLGPTGTLWAFVLTTIAGGAIALIVAARRRRLRLTFQRSFDLVRTGAANAAEIENSPSAGNRFAYAPAIAVGAISAAVFV